MKKYVLSIIFLCGLVCSHASDTLSFTKVFQVEIDSVYNFYIDTIGTTSGGVEICFQTTTGKLVKTNISGTILNMTDNPYKYFTFWNGDTIILQNKSILSVKGDTIAKPVAPVVTSSECRLIAASSEGIYIYVGGDIDSRSVAWSWQIMNVLEEYGSSNPLYSTPINGLCFYQGRLYCINYLTKDEHGSLKTKSVTNTDAGNNINGTIPFQQPVGVAGYGGYLYIFSNYDKSLYRLDPSQTTTGININPIEILDVTYYNLSGQETETPSGLTIVVTRYSDGTVRTEKKIFR